MYLAHGVVTMTIEDFAREFRELLRKAVVDGLLDVDEVCEVAEQILQEPPSE